jgi:hypothetical protein
LLQPEESPVLLGQLPEQEVPQFNLVGPLQRSSLPQHPPSHQTARRKTGHSGVTLGPQQNSDLSTSQTPKSLFSHRRGIFSGSERIVDRPSRSTTCAKSL